MTTKEYLADKGYELKKGVDVATGYEIYWLEKHDRILCHLVDEFYTPILFGNLRTVYNFFEKHEVDIHESNTQWGKPYKWYLGNFENGGNDNE